jgi:hypothetical protein
MAAKANPRAGEPLADGMPGLQEFHKAQTRGLSACSLAELVAARRPARLLGASRAFRRRLDYAIERQSQQADGGGWG